MARALLLILLVSNLLGQEIKAIKCGFTHRPPAKISAKTIVGRGFDYLEESVLSPSEHFRIHFTRSDIHAVVGASTVGTPDFILEAGIAADSIYTVLVSELGFQPPIPDNGVDGSELDIYIVDMKTNHGNYYGLTTFDQNYSTPYTGVSTYLEVDNSYDESFYSTSGLEALRVTIAHEFFHMVQLRYSHPFQPYASNAYWYEISSTWVEEKCYPDIDDYHAYTNYNLNQVIFPNLDDGSFSYTYSYGHALFGQVLDTEYGTQAGKHIMLDIWENLDAREATANLEQVLNSSPWYSSLADALGKYALYNVFTGSRAIEGSYYADAPELSEIRTSENILPQSFLMPFTFMLEPMQTSYEKFSIQSPSDIFVRGDNLGQDQRAYLTYFSSEDGASLKSALGDPWVPCYETDILDYLVIPMVNGDRDASINFDLEFGSSLEYKNAIQIIWPNPILLASDQLKLNLMLSTAGTIKLKVYNILGQIIHEQSQHSPEGIHTIELTLPYAIQSGIYFVQLIAGQSTHSRKVTILK
jgi:hypothetical protein